MKTIKLTDTIDISYEAASKDEFDKYERIDTDAINQRAINTYHSKAIQKKAKISAIQISHWTKTGVIVPATAVKGTGKMHVYDHQNLIETMICRELSQYSINYGVMREVLDFLRKKRWLFYIGLSYKSKPESATVIDGHVTATSTRTILEIQKHHTFWEFFRFYPQQGMINLLMWKNSTSIEMPETKKTDYNIHLITENVSEIVQRCQSAIVINLSLLLTEAGSFYEETEK